MGSSCWDSKNPPRNWLQTVPLSIRRKSEVKDSGLPKEKMHEWMDKRSTQRQQCWLMCRWTAADHLINAHSEQQGSIAMTFLFFPLQTDREKWRVLPRSLPVCFDFHSSRAQRAEWQDSRAQLWRHLSVKGWIRAAESAFTQSHWPRVAAGVHSRTIPTFMA